MFKCIGYVISIICSMFLAGLYGWGAWALGMGMTVGSIVYILCDEKRG